MARLIIESFQISTSERRLYWDIASALGWLGAAEIRWIIGTEHSRTKPMWSIAQARAYFRRRESSVFEFLDEFLGAFEWSIIAGVSGLFFLYLLYSLVPPPLHVLGAGAP